jgi:hypothetical protein
MIDRRRSHHVPAAARLVAIASLLLAFALIYGVFT